jgi:hypothetical protein
MSIDTYMSINAHKMVWRDKHWTLKMLSSWEGTRIGSGVQRYISFFLIFILLLCWVGVHWSICESSYNVSNTSYLNSPPSAALFYPLSSDSWKSLNRFHFYLHVYKLFGPPPSPTPPTPSLGRTCFTLFFYNFVEEKP